MFTILDGRAELWQWDIDRKIVVEDATITEVHFCNGLGDCSLVTEVRTEDGKRIADIPNILLQEHPQCKLRGYFELRVFAHCADNYTKTEKKFIVRARTKPEDYVYTETEVLNYASLVERITALENGGGGKLYSVRVFVDCSPLVRSYDDPKKIGTENYTDEDYAYIDAYTEEKVTSKVPSIEEFLNSCKCGADYLQSRENAVQINGWFGSNYDQESFDTPLRFYCTETEDAYTFYVDYERCYYGREETAVWQVSHEEVGNYITIEVEEL